MRTLFYNGLFYQGQTFAEAMIIEDHRIAFVGTQAEAKANDPVDEAIDLQGKLVIPGFNDSHMHLFGTAFTMEQLLLHDVRSIPALQSKLRNRLNSPEFNGVFLTARGFNQDYFEEKRFPTKKDLNQVSTTIPIIVTRVCGHICVCNSAALKASNITPSTQVEGGEIDFETGLLTEKALGLLFTNQLVPTKDEVKRLVKKGLKEAAKWGITTIQTDDLMHAFPHDFTKMIEVYQELDQAGELTARLVLQSQLPTLPLLNEYIEKEYPNRVFSDRLRMGPLKILTDGTLGARTAAMLKPYADDPNTLGVLTYSNDELYQLVKTAHQANMAVAMHAIGDRAMNQVLDTYERILQEFPRKDHRHTIIHCQITSQEILDRMAKLDVYAAVQPIFIDYDMQIVYDRVGELANTSYAFYSMIQKGINVAIGTDAPVEPMNPFENLRAAITRTNLQGQLYLEHEKMPVSVALDAYTKSSATQVGWGHELGQLKSGYFADFVVLNGNDFSKLYQLPVDFVYMDGKRVS